MFERRLAESRKKLENARHQKRLDFGMPDELSYDTGRGQIRIRFLMQGHIFTFVRNHPMLRDGDPRRDAMLAELRDVLSRFRTRAPGEVPEEPGVCLPYAFIADDGTRDYHTHASFRYPDRPGVVYSIDTGYRPPDGQRGVAQLPIPAPVRVLSYPAAITEVFRGRVRGVYPITPRGARIGPYSADQGGLSVNVARSASRIYTPIRFLLDCKGFRACRRGHSSALKRTATRACSTTSWQRTRLRSRRHRRAWMHC